MSNARSAPPLSHSAEPSLKSAPFVATETSHETPATQAEMDSTAALSASTWSADSSSQPNATQSSATQPKLMPGQSLHGREPAVTLSIPAVSDYVRVARLAVTGVASRMRFSYDQVEDIKIAVSEACNNAILHATPDGDAPASIEQAPLIVIQLVPYADRLEINIVDQGTLEPPGLVLEARIAPTASSDTALETSDLPESGLGLMLIQSLMDEVTSSSGQSDQTVLHMVKHLRPL